MLCVTQAAAGAYIVSKLHGYCWAAQRMSF